MIPQCIIYPCAASFTINQHFEGQAAVPACLADVGRCDSVIIPPDDFFYGLFQFAAVGAYYFIDPPAGIVYGGLFTVCIRYLFYCTFPPWVCTRPCPQSIRGKKISSRGELQSIAEDGGNC